MTKTKKTSAVHLYKGSPCVRVWSKYQETDKQWALCGIKDKRWMAPVRG